MAAVALEVPPYLVVQVKVVNPEVLLRGLRPAILQTVTQVLVALAGLEMLRHLGQREELLLQELLEILEQALKMVNLGK